jgi:hypothetical protein
MAMDAAGLQVHESLLNARLAEKGKGNLDWFTWWVEQPLSY